MEATHIQRGDIKVHQGDGKKSMSFAPLLPRCIGDGIGNGIGVGIGDGISVTVGISGGIVGGISGGIVRAAGSVESFSSR